MSTTKQSQPHGCSATCYIRSSVRRVVSRVTAPIVQVGSTSNIRVVSWKFTRRQVVSSGPRGSRQGGMWQGGVYQVRTVRSTRQYHLPSSHLVCTGPSPKYCPDTDSTPWARLHMAQTQNLTFVTELIGLAHGMRWQTLSSAPLRQGPVPRILISACNGARCPAANRVVRRRAGVLSAG